MGRGGVFIRRRERCITHLSFRAPFLLAGPPLAGDVSAAGLSRSEHPLLGAVTELADQDQIVVSGRLSTATQGWLTGHMVGEAVLLPATGFIDVVLAAGERAGCPVIDELVLHTPLVLAEHPPTDVQVTVHPIENDTRRQFTVHARPGGDDAGAAGRCTPPAC